MAITNENQIIDVAAISNACSVIEEAAGDYIKCANKVSESADICSPDALAVENQSMQPTLEELAVGISKVEQSVRSFTAEIRNVATQIYSKQYEELIAYRNRKAAEEQAAQNSQGNTGQTTNPTGGGGGNGSPRQYRPGSNVDSSTVY